MAITKHDFRSFIPLLQYATRALHGYCNDFLGGIPTYPYMLSPDLHKRGCRDCPRRLSATSGIVNSRQNYSRHGDTAAERVFIEQHVRLAGW